MKNKNAACIINNGTDEVTIEISKEKFKERAFDIIDIMIDQVITLDEPKNKDDLENKIIDRCFEGIRSEWEKEEKRSIDFVYVWTLAGIIKNISEEKGYKAKQAHGDFVQKFLIGCVKRGMKFRYV